MISKLAEKLSLIKANKINKHCSSYVQGDLLDVGAGRCYIANTLKQKNNIDVHCVDIQDQNKTELKLELYDGSTLPYKENEVGTILLCYVLHHCKNPEIVLKECVRVCKHRIIIFEDSDPTFFTKWMDYSFYTLRGVKAPLNFKTKSEWTELFKKLDLKIIKVESGVEKEWFYPFVEHTMFVLEK